MLPLRHRGLFFSMNVLKEWFSGYGDIITKVYSRPFHSYRISLYINSYISVLHVMYLYLFGKHTFGDRIIKYRFLFFNYRLSFNPPSPSHYLICWRAVKSALNHKPKSKAPLWALHIEDLGKEVFSQLESFNCVCLQ